MSNTLLRKKIEKERLSWNRKGGLTESAQGPVGSPVVYAYDDADRLTEVKAEIETGREAKNAYTYRNDRLTEISHNTTGATNDVKYTLEYVSLGNNTAVKVITGTNPEDEVSLVQRAFTNDRRHLPITETTGNGSTVSFAYDEFGRITSRTVDSDLNKVVSYQYGKDGRLEKTANTETGTTERIRYDLAGREMSRETKDTNGNTVHAAYAAYNEAQNVSMHVEKLKAANGTLKSYKTRYVYDRDDRIAATLFGEDADTTRTTLIYDGLGRVTNRKTYNGSSCTITESYTYAPGYTGYSANAATDLITGMSQTGMVQSYTYDDNGRISSWICNNKKCSYEYDAIGQLIRVNDEKDTRGHSTGTTWVYEYDNGGNILARKRYVYTEGTLPANPDAADTWTYDAGWKDEFAKFNGVDIESDAIGNIIDNGIWQYTWEGRKLVGMSNNSKTISFLYDENGQRIRKAVTENGNTVTTEYVVSGKSVTHVIKGTEDLHIFYANGQPSHCKYGNSMYTYVYSLQGDVLGLKDNTSALVVTYLYDAWGNIISAGGTLASTLGSINPFRYRGYVYDNEIGWYYISQRYYIPEFNRWINADSQINNSIGILGLNQFSYCQNKPINKVDYCGNKPEDIFEDIDKAAIDFAEYINKKSIKENREYISYIYEVETEEIREERIDILTYLWNVFSGKSMARTVTNTRKVIRYSYREPKRGTNDRSNISIEQSDIDCIVAILHTHAAYDSYYEKGNDFYSPTDINMANDLGIPSFLATPFGSLFKYDPAYPNDIRLITANIPYDPNHPFKQ